MLATCAANPDDDAGWLVLADLLQENSEGAYKACPKCTPNYKTANGGGLGWLLGGQPGSYFHVPCMNCGGKRTNGGILNDDNKGTGIVPDTSRADRAELIRVQVELAKLKQPLSGFHGCVECKSGAAEDLCTFHRLQPRESAIIAANPDWSPKCATCHGRLENMLMCSGCQLTGKAPCTWRAGYPAVVSVPTIASVLGLGPEEVDIPNTSTIRRLQPTEYARYLHASFSPTLTGVMPVDKSPWEIENPGVVGPYFWRPETGPGGERERLPMILFEALNNPDKDRYGSYFPTAELAKTALSCALKALVWDKIAEERK